MNTGAPSVYVTITDQKSPATCKGQMRFLTPSTYQMDTANEMPLLSVSSVFQERPDDKSRNIRKSRDHECGTVSTGYYTIIHPWVKTHEKLSSLNRGVFFFFSSFNHRGLGTVRGWAFYSDSHVAIKSMCHLVGFVIWRFGWSSTCASKPIQEVGRIHCLRRRLRLMASYWLLNGGHPQVLGTVLISAIWPFS